MKKRGGVCLEVQLPVYKIPQREMYLIRLGPTRIYYIEKYATKLKFIKGIPSYAFKQMKKRVFAPKVPAPHNLVQVGGYVGTL